VSSFATFSFLVVAPAAQRRFDVVLLPALGPTAEQNDERLAVPAEVDAIAGAAIDLQLGGTFADRLDVRRVALGQPLDGDRHGCGRLNIQIVEPSPEGTGAFGDILFNPDQRVSYMLP
jgi:hypothetical protein